MSGPAAPDASRPRYLLPPLDRRGLVLGLRAGSVVALVAGAVTALGALRALPGAPGVGVALAAAAVAVAGACWPIGGQPPVSWLPAMLGWAQRRRSEPRLDTAAGTGTRLLLRAGTPAGRGVGQAPGRPRRPPSPTAPPGIRLGAAPDLPGDGAMGVVEDLAARSWAAVIPVRGAGLSLLGADEQARRLASWGAALAGAARSASAVHRVQWVEQCSPADPETLRAAARSLAGPEGPASGYRAAVEAEAAGTLSHRAWVVVTVRAPGHLGVRPMSPPLLNDLLRREVRLLRAQLRGGDLDAGAPLGPAELGALIRDASDPTRPAGRPGMQESGPAQALAAAWPAALDERWSSVRVDGTWQASYWIAEWPRLPVGPDVLGPLLLGGASRTVAVTMAPIPPERAARQVQSARTAALADEALRTRAGFLDTIARRREAEGIRRREEELAEGHADYRYSGYVGVVASTPEQLEEACAEVVHAARQSHLVLRRLYGRQAEARTWTLPLGRGLS